MNLGGESFESVGGRRWRGNWERNCGNWAVDAVDFRYVSKTPQTDLMRSLFYIPECTDCRLD